MTTRAPGMSIGDFMNHDPGGGGGRNKYMKDWKDKGFKNVWIHPGANILTAWRHSFVQLKVLENKETHTTTREVWSDNLVCYEDEDILGSQNFREGRDPRGKREYPPQVCPFCIMLEHLVQLIREGHLDWRTPVFRFEGTDPRKTRTYHAGGITGLFNGKSLTDAQKAEISGAESTDPVKLAAQRSGQDRWFPASKWFGPIYQTGEGENVAFKLDARPRHEYVMTVLDNDDIAAGVQLSFVGKLLGDKTRMVIAKSIKEFGDAGDIQKRPYVIRWEYNSQTKQINEKYDAMRMSQIPMTPAVAKLLRSEPPDISKLAERFNLKTLRARLEQHLVLKKLPLDAYFAKAFELEARAKAAPPAESIPEVGRNPGSVQESSFDPAPGPSGFDPGFVPAANPNAAGTNPGVQTFVAGPGVSGAAGGGGAAVGPADQMCGCDDCGKAIRVSDPKCPHCGKVYIIEDVAPPPPPPALPKRSAVVGSPAAPPPPPAQASPAHSVATDPWLLEPSSVATRGRDDATGSGSGTFEGQSGSPSPDDPAWPGDPSSDIPF